MTGRHARFLNLGAGVDSTALLIASLEGVVERVDAAVFADTGWEPSEVYEHLDALERFAGEAGVPVYRVSHGNLRDDVLNPGVFATIPCFVKLTEESPWPSVFGRCPSCRGFQMVSDGDDLCPDCAGTGQVPTAWELRSGIVRIGRVLRQCTPKYKVDPVSKKVRELLGARAYTEGCRYCESTGQRVAPWDTQKRRGPCSVCRGTGERQRVGSVPQGAACEQWIGFDASETERATNIGFPAYSTPRWPLMELGWRRQDCIDWLAERGWKGVSRSSCLGCPFHDDETWVEMADQRPDEFAEQVAFDRDFRHADGLRGERFLHASCLPLDEAIAAYRIRKADSGDQDVLWPEFKKKRVVRKCNPFGCRSEEMEPGEVVFTGLAS